MIKVFSLAAILSAGMLVLSPTAFSQQMTVDEFNNPQSSSDKDKDALKAAKEKCKNSDKNAYEGCMSNLGIPKDKY